MVLVVAVDDAGIVGHPVGGFAMQTSSGPQHGWSLGQTVESPLMHTEKV